MGGTCPCRLLVPEKALQDLMLGEHNFSSQSSVSVSLPIHSFMPTYLEALRHVHAYAVLLGPLVCNTDGNNKVLSDCHYISWMTIN